MNEAWMKPDLPAAHRFKNQAMGKAATGATICCMELKRYNSLNFIKARADSLSSLNASMKSLYSQVESLISEGELD